MFLALAQLTNKAFTDAGKGRIRQSLTALVFILLSFLLKSSGWFVIAVYGSVSAMELVKYLESL